MPEKFDPRVLFAAERTLLAWSRTSISLMVFGFVIERFGIFLQIMRREEVEVLQRHFSFIIGELFLLLAVFMSVYSIWQYRKVVRNLPPSDIPEGYNLSSGVFVNAVIGGLGVVLSVYLAQGFI